MNRFPPQGGVSKADFNSLISSQYGLKISAVIDTATDSLTSEKDNYPVLFGVKMTNARDDSQPRPIGWLYYNSANELLYANGKPDNMRKLCDWDASITYGGNSTPDKYSPLITEDGDIIFVFRGELLGDTLPVNPNARQNPIIYPAGDYANPVVIDFGEDIKPTSWLQNRGVEYINGQDCFIFAEYTRPVHEYCYVWKVTKPFAVATNWAKVKTFTVSGSVSSGFEHCHCINYDPWSAMVYLTTGDDNNGAAIYGSSDYGVTWTTLISGSEKYGRLLNFIFTKDAVYWGSDSGLTDKHYFFQIPRGSSGVPDFANIKELYKFPNKTSEQATYALCYINNPHGLLFLDRCDAINTLPFNVYFWSFETNSMHIIDTLYTMGGASLNNGFRCEAINCYQAIGDDRIMCGFGVFPNNNEVLNNTATDRVNNLALEVVRKNWQFSFNLSSSYNSSFTVLGAGAVSVPYYIAYNGGDKAGLIASYCLDGGTPTTATVHDKDNICVTEALALGAHTLTITVSDGNGNISNTLQFSIAVVEMPSLLLPDTWENGSIGLTGILENPAVLTRLRTSQYIPMKPGATYNYNLNFNVYKFSIREYRATYEFISSDQAYRTEAGSLTISPTTSWIKIVVARIDNQNIAPNDMATSSFIFAEAE
jgi:hypothetical protein